jgi:uncharacterized membrane protein YhiD involved in acid resistance
MRLALTLPGAGSSRIRTGCTPHLPRSYAAFRSLPMMYELTLQLAAALVVGVMIGIERQWHHQMAGLRTHVLVAVGAAVFCLIAALSDHEASPSFPWCIVPFAVHNGLSRVFLL